jgi:hypothetical protein
MVSPQGFLSTIYIQYAARIGLDKEIVTGHFITSSKIREPKLLENNTAET